MIGAYRRKPRKPRKEAAPETRNRRQRPEPLPDAVLEVIDAASIVRRPNGQDDAPRGLVQLPGWQPFMFTDEKADMMMGKVFPELTEEQQHQAARRLRTRVIARFRMLDAAVHGGGDTRPWVQRY